MELVCAETKVESGQQMRATTLCGICGDVGRERLMSSLRHFRAKNTMKTIAAESGL